MSEDVLKYTQGKVDQGTVRRAYKKWRTEQGIPDRCDNPSCQFHTSALEWDGKLLKLILDHSNGVNSDNRPENLRFLCPNCNAQLETHGGGNKGKVLKSSGGFGIVGRDGKKRYTLPAEPGRFSLQGSPVNLTKKP